MLLHLPTPVFMGLCLPSTSSSLCPSPAHTPFFFHLFNDKTSQGAHFCKGGVEDVAEIHAAVEQLFQHWEEFYIYLYFSIYFLKMYTIYIYSVHRIGSILEASPKEWCEVGINMSNQVQGPAVAKSVMHSLAAWLKEKKVEP